VPTAQRLGKLPRPHSRGVQYFLIYLIALRGFPHLVGVSVNLVGFHLGASMSFFVGGIEQERDTPANDCK